jgi:hypothetical protein
VQQQGDVALGRLHDLKRPRHGGEDFLVHRVDQD